jgi:hypothetical protein
MNGDGEYLGHVRRDTTQPGPGDSWVAVTVRQDRPCGRYDSAEVAARGLARARGRDEGLR